MLRVTIDGGVADGNGSCHATAVEVNHGLVAASHLNDAVIQRNGIEKSLHLVTIDELLCQPLHLHVGNGDIAQFVESSFLIGLECLKARLDIHQRCSQCRCINRCGSGSIALDGQITHRLDGLAHGIFAVGCQVDGYTGGIGIALHDGSQLCTDVSRCGTQLDSLAYNRCRRLHALIGNAIEVDGRTSCGDDIGTSLSQLVCLRGEPILEIFRLLYDGELAIKHGEVGLVKDFHILAVIRLKNTRVFILCSGLATIVNGQRQILLRIQHDGRAATLLCAVRIFCRGVGGITHLDIVGERLTRNLLDGTLQCRLIHRCGSQHVIVDECRAGCNGRFLRCLPRVCECTNRQ